MSKFQMMFFFVLIFAVVACTPQDTITPTREPLNNMVTSTVEIVPIMTVTSTSTTAQPSTEITLSKIKEWKGYHAGAWFTKSDQFALLLDASLDVYDPSMNLIWSVPQNSSEVDAALAISPDDKTIAIYDSYQDGAILLDSLTGKREITSGQDNCMIQVYTNNMFFTPQNYLIVGFDGELDKGNRPIQISVWNISPLSCFHEKIEIPLEKGEPSSIYAMKTSLDGQYFAAISTHFYDEYRGIIRVWSSKNLSLVCEMPGIYASFRPTDGLLAVLDKEGDTLSYFDVESCSVSKTLKLPGFAQEQEMEFTSDGKYLIFLRHGFQIFDADNGNLVYEDESDIFGGFGVLKISPNGKYLLSIIADSGPVTALWKINYSQSQ